MAGPDTHTGVSGQSGDAGIGKSMLGRRQVVGHRHEGHFPSFECLHPERLVIETLSSFIFWNFFEHFPNVKLLSAENGTEWVPAMLTRMDKCRGVAKTVFGLPASSRTDRAASSCRISAWNMIWSLVAA